MVGYRRSRQNEVVTEMWTQTTQRTSARETQLTLYGCLACMCSTLTQTEGKDLPTLTEVNGDVSGYRERLFKFVEAQSVELSFSEELLPPKVSPMAGRSRSLSGMQPAEEFSTLVHEIAHLC